MWLSPLILLAVFCPDPIALDPFALPSRGAFDLLSVLIFWARGMINCGFFLASIL
jgi:hypothetical protein